MTIPELIKNVREQNLSKEKLEGYHIELTCLYAEMCDRAGNLEKEEALYLAECNEPTKAGAQRKFNVTQSGLELITLKHNLRAVEKLASSIRSRAYKFL